MRSSISAILCQHGKGGITLFQGIYADHTRISSSDPTFAFPLPVIAGAISQDEIYSDQGKGQDRDKPTTLHELQGPAINK